MRQKWRIYGLSDILGVARDDKIPAHFIGSLVYVEKGIYHVSSVTQLLIIDGQQRLTTLSLLLAVLGEALEEPGRETSSEITRKKICNYYLFNVEESDDAHYKLLLTQSDRETLIRILEGREEPHSVSNHIKQNYQFFKQQMHQDRIDPITLYKGISKLIIVDISLEQQDNPQLIFESLNSTGMDLSQVDLIRNYVLMGLDNDEQTRLYKSYWYPMEQSFSHTQNVTLFNRFMRDYLTLKSKTGDIPNIDKVYATFKLYHQNRSATPIEEIIADIYRYSKYFTKMAFSQEKDADIRRVLNDIDILQVYVAYPFLLEVYDDYEHQLLCREDFIAILRLVESYVFRRAICGIPTNSLNKIFATLVREIDKSHYLESVQAAFLLKIASGRFPRDEEFRAEFVVKDIYNFRNRSYLLGKLENYGRKELVNLGDYTIEHIMPQNGQLSAEWRQELGPNWKEIQAQYLHTLGNLTLTGYNSELSDRPFHEKRDREGGFADSPLRLNKGLARLEHWNEEEITKRAFALADLAIKVWPIPVLSPEQINKYSKQAQKGALAEAGKSYTLADYPTLQGNMRDTFVHLHRRILNLDSSVREEYKKYYIAYKTTTNFVDVEPQKKRLRLSLNMKFSEINDPKGLCRDITGVGHFGNGDVEITVTALDQIDDVMDLVRQAFEKHWEESDAQLL